MAVACFATPRLSHADFEGSYGGSYGNSYGGGSYSTYRPAYSGGGSSRPGPLLSLEMDEKKILNVDFRVSARQERVEDVKRLLKEGADVNSQSETGETALMYASRQCSVETVQILLDAKAKVNLRDALGRNALMYAVMESCQPVVQMLLKDPRLELGAVDESNHTALDYSQDESNTEVDGPSITIVHLLRRAAYLHPLRAIRRKASAEAHPAQSPHS